MRRFESSRPSQAVRRSEKAPLILAERPANGGLLRISHRSPGSDFGHSQSETANSLWRTFEKFPFLGDCGRRPGSICTDWPSLQCNSPNSPPWRPAIWEFRGRTAAPSLECNYGVILDLLATVISRHFKLVEACPLSRQMVIDIGKARIVVDIYPAWHLGVLPRGIKCDRKNPLAIETD
jgi:hypothetical protein